MSDKLKKFVTEHKQEFDAADVPKELWSKIDSKLEVKDASQISSNFLSKFKYLGFSASILIIAIYAIATNLKETAPKDTTVSKKEQQHSSTRVKSSQSEFPVMNESNSSKEIGNENTTSVAHADISSENKVPLYDTLRMKKEEGQETPDFVQKTLDVGTDSAETESNNATVVKNTKRTKLYIPEDPDKENTYTGTLYTGSSFCAMLRAYRFPGKVGLDMGGYKNAENYKIKMTTISCSRLSRIPNMKAIWLKGKTSKKIMFSLKNKFNSIQLVKSDGRKIKPEAISHYYTGLLVISDYNGKFFNMAFEDKVDMILFFKDAEEGDKIVIGDMIEAYVKAQP